jgi:hypothetical protein
MLDFVDEPLDQMTLLVEVLVVGDSRASGSGSTDNGISASVGNGASKAIGVVTLVCENGFLRIPLMSLRRSELMLHTHGLPLTCVAAWPGPSRYQPEAARWSCSLTCWVLGQPAALRHQLARNVLERGH